MSNSNADESPEKFTTHPPPPPPSSLSSLPDDVVLGCLALVPRSYHLKLSWVSKHLRTLVRSPELNKLRSVLHKKSSLHLCFQEKNKKSTIHWLTLRPTETREYRLVPNPTPFPSNPNYRYSTVIVESKIFFIGGSRGSSTDLWILDTRSGNMTQGPSMNECRRGEDAAVGVIDGKIYVIGGGLFREEIQVEVFDLKSETWELAGRENLRKITRYSVLVEGKVYMVEYKKTSVYNPRGGEGERMVHMVTQRLLEDGSKEKFTDTAHCVCVVDDIFFAFFNRSGILWFDTKLNVWRRLVGLDGNDLFFLHADAISENDGRLVVLSLLGESEVGDTVTKSVWCMLVSLHRAGETVCATIDWSGIVATVPSWFRLLRCLAVSE